jgi:hypothetical protein
VAWFSLQKDEYERWETAEKIYTHGNLARMGFGR